jgi:hypothetical protein
MQLYTISIPAKPHIARFAHIRYGNPIWLNADSTLGILISALLNQSAYRSKFTLSDRDLRFKYLTASIQCAAPLSEMLRGKCFALSTDHVLAVNQFLENDFEERLYFYCQRQANWQKRRAGIDAAIESFADFYGIQLDEEITFDGLKKMEYRFRKKKTEKIFAEMSPHKMANQKFNQMLLL